MGKKINQGMIMRALDFCYDKAVNGLPLLETAEELANSYLAGEGVLDDKAKKLTGSGSRGQVC